MPTAIPMISTTSDVLVPTGSHWPMTDSSETAAMTAVTASSTGMPAATSAPNTTSSKISVTGYRGRLGLVEVAAERGADGAGDARVAGLRDDQVRMFGLHRRDGVLRGLDR